jgi:hypothetical protein
MLHHALEEAALLLQSPAKFLVLQLEPLLLCAANGDAPCLPAHRPSWDAASNWALAALLTQTK